MSDERADDGRARLVAHATRKHRKTAVFVQKLTGWALDQCIEFAVLFEWQIAQHRGADNLLASWVRE